LADRESLTLDDTRLMVQFANATRSYAAPRLRLDWARRAVAVRRRLLPSDHVDVIEALVAYAYAADDAGELSEARDALARAFRLVGATLPADAELALDAARLQYRYWINDGADGLAQELRATTLRDAGVDLFDTLGNTLGGST
jgi:hypothetical protein